MGNILRLGLAASLLFSAACAVAAEWRAVGSNEKLRVEMDAASLKRVGKIAEAWDKETYFKPEQAMPGDFYFSSVKTLSRYGCDQGLAETLMQVYYAGDGAEIKTVVPGGNGHSGYVVPDTVGEWKYNYACGKPVGATKTKPKVKKPAAKAKKKPAAKNGTSPPKNSVVPVKPPVTTGKPAAPVRSLPAPAAVPAEPASVPMRSAPAREPVKTLETLIKKTPPAQKP